MKRSSPQQSNRLLSVVKLSLSVGAKHLAPYGSTKSRHDFTQRQLMTCLILRTYLKTTYRGVIEQLGVSSELREAIGLQKLPNYSTLKKFADRPGVREVLEAMLQTLARMVDRADKSLSKEAAMDSTGLETSSASAHFRARSGKKRKRYVKLSVVVLCGSLVPASLVVDWGPTNDKVEARPLLERAAQVIRPDSLFADAGYDAEWIHAYCHEQWGVASVIKPVRHTSGPPEGPIVA